MMRRVSCFAAMVCLGFSATVSGQARRAPTPSLDADDDHAIVFEIGAAADWEPEEGAVHKGGTFAFEVTPIEHWLELEIGVTAIAAGAAVEMPIDVLLKKPWRPSPYFEFMIGIGPELIHVSGPDRGTFWGIEGVLDFMFWPTKNVGWYVEPGYEITFRDGARHRGIGVAAGLLIGK